MKKDLILAAALQFAIKQGYQNVRRESIAEELKISCGIINYHFGTMTQLRRAIMREAIRLNIPLIVAQGLAVKDPQAMKAPEALKAVARSALG